VSSSSGHWPRAAFDREALLLVDADTPAPGPEGDINKARFAFSWARQDSRLDRT
jgi:hypothetical protein